MVYVYNNALYPVCRAYGNFRNVVCEFVSFFVDLVREYKSVGTRCRSRDARVSSTASRKDAAEVVSRYENILQKHTRAVVVGVYKVPTIIFLVRRAYYIIILLIAVVRCTATIHEEFHCLIYSKIL